MTMDCVTTVTSLADRLTEIRNYSSENVVELISRLDLLSSLPITSGLTGYKVNLNRIANASALLVMLINI